MPLGNIDQKQIDLMYLRLARERIAQPGAWSHNGYGRDGAFCPVGWLCEVTLGEDTLPEFRRATKYLAAALPWWWRVSFGRITSPASSVGLFNDAPWRRHSRVVKLFDVAIELASRD